MNGDQIWRNTRWGRMTSYLKHDEVSWNFPKLWKLLQAYGSAFDDRWAYRLTKGYVLRTPVWDKPRSGSYYEDKDERTNKKMENSIMVTILNHKKSF